MTSEESFIGELKKLLHDTEDEGTRKKLRSLSLAPPKHKVKATNNLPCGKIRDMLFISGFDYMTMKPEELQHIMDEKKITVKEGGWKISREQIKEGKVTDFLACFKELLNGVPVRELYQKYVKVDVLITLELRDRGITLQELEDFIRGRNAHIAVMESNTKKKLWLAIRK